MNNIDDTEDCVKYTCGFCHMCFFSWSELEEHFKFCSERKKWIKENTMVYVHEKISFPTSLKNFGEGLQDE